MRALLMAIAMMFGAGVANAQDDPHAGHDVVWARPGGQDLQARIYAPLGDARAPVIIDVHGGAWVGGSRTDGELYDRALAAAGFLVVAIDYRHGPDFKHPTASADVAAAVRWVRLNAERLGADPDRIGMIGSSAGGHLGLLAALRANDASHRGTPIFDANNRPRVHDDIDASVDYVIALWTPADPIARYRYAQRANLQNLMNGGVAYFGDEASMRDASTTRIVAEGNGPLPALLLVQAGRDGNVPAEITTDLLHAYQQRDGAVELAYFPTAAHAFGHRDSADTQEMLRIVIDFAKRKSAL
jgi:acetyl esterase/lipase